MFEPSISCPLAKPRPREEFLLRITTTSCIFLPLFSLPSTLPNMWATLSSSLPYPYAAGGEDRRVPLLLFLPNPKFGPSCFLFLSPPSLYPHTTPPSSHFPLIWFRTLARFFSLAAEDRGGEKILECSGRRRRKLILPTSTLERARYGYKGVGNGSDSLPFICAAEKPSHANVFHRPLSRMDGCP